jgi:hypothetical protein
MRLDITRVDDHDQPVQRIQQRRFPSSISAKQKRDRLKSQIKIYEASIVVQEQAANHCALL